MIRRYALGTCLFALLLAMDRAAKTFVFAQKSVLNGRAIIPRVLEFCYAENYGAAFSMLPGMQPFFLCLALASAIIALIYIYRHPKLPPLIFYALCAFLAGAVGNAWDRWAYGFVIDYIRPIFVNFAIFNIADICISCSVALIAIAIFWDERRKHA